MESPIILTIRGQRVMLDFQLAPLYGLETKVLNQAVKRNLERFDEDFMFQLNSSDLAEARSQIVTLSGLTSEYSIGNYLPYAFTELGIAMLSSVLRSREAIEVNKGIMRAFFKMRSYLMLGHDLGERVNKLENDSREVRQTFSEVFERLDNVEDAITPSIPKRRRKIGLKS